MKSLACFLACIATTFICNVALSQSNFHGVVFSFHSTLESTELEDLENYPDLQQLFENYSADSVTKAYRGAPPESRIHKYFKVWVDSVSKFALRDSMIEYFSATVDLVELDGDFFTLAHYPDDYGKEFNDEQHALDFIKAPLAWEISSGDNGIIIAILNEAPEDHEDLDANVVYKYTSNDPDGHGTKVAGCAAAVTDNDKGLSSIGYNSKMYFQYAGNLYDPVIGAVSAGARVVSVSVVSFHYSQATQDLYEQLYDDGIIAFAGAGNGACWELFGRCNKLPCDEICPTSIPCDKYSPNDNLGTIGNGECMIYPASYNKVTSVSSIGHHNDLGWQDPFDQREYFWKDIHESVIGEPLSTHTHNDSVDLCAPGWHIETTFPGNSYAHTNGTSFSTPMVAGIAALMIDVRQCLSPEEIEWILKRTAVNVDNVMHNNVNLNDPYIGKLGAGRVDAYEALKWVDDGLSFEIKEGENVTWEATRRISGKVVVKPEGSLTIEGNVLFSGDGQIIVERGGRLVIDGGILTYGVTKVSGCPETGFWKGIEVHGHHDEPHTASIATQALSGTYPSDQEDHGVVIVKNGARIENAYVGIRNAKMESWGFNQDYSGGIILVEDATIANCWKSVEMWRFRPDQDGSAASAANVSRFYNTDFITTDEWPDPLKLPQAFVTMWENHSVVFRQCRFENEDYQQYDIEKQGTGIRSFNASYHVVGNCISPLPATQCNIGPCHFEGLTMGIDAQGLANMNAYLLVYNNTFTNVQRGIRLAGANFGHIHNNIFYINDAGEGPGFDTYGIRTERATGFDIQGNSFSLESQYLNSYGTIVRNSTFRNITTGGITSLLGNNEYTNHLTGIQTEQYNGNGQRGLALNCNSLTAHQTGIGVSPSGKGSLRDQGDGCTNDDHQPGNDFYSITCDYDPPVVLHIKVGINDIVYYEDPDNPAPSNEDCVKLFQTGALGNTPAGYLRCNSNGDPVDCSYVSPFSIPHTYEDTPIEIKKEALRSVIGESEDLIEVQEARTELVRLLLYVDSVDAAIAQVVELPGTEKYYLLAATGYGLGNATMAREWLDSITVTEGYDTIHYDVLDILVSALEAGRNVDSLQVGELAQLESLHQSDSAASVLAENLLGFINDTLYHRLAELWPESEGKWDGQDVEKTLNETEIWLGQNVPNPATNRTAIPYKVPEGADAYLEISDLHGRRLGLVRIPDGYNTIELSLQELPKGILIYRLLLDGLAPIARPLVNL